MHRLRMYRHRRRLVRRRMRVLSASNIERLPAMYRYEDECCSEASVAKHEDQVSSLCSLTNNTFFKSKDIENVVKAVNRNHFMFNTGLPLKSPYFDNTTEGNYEAGDHICFAPLRELDSVHNYSRILENLQLSKGDSFLHLGSGTGYLNTLAGLLIGANGINHGVEIQDAMVAYAEERQDAFKDHCKNLQKFEYCEPVFIQGDCLKLSLETRYYDRIYCSGILPEGYDFFLRIYLKPGGLLMYPRDCKTFTKISLGLYNRYLTEEDSVINDLKVYPFHTEKSGSLTLLPEKVLPTLQELARSAIRIKLRSSLSTPVGHEEIPAPLPEPGPADAFRRMFGSRVNMNMNVSSESSDDSDEEINEIIDDRDVAIVALENDIHTIERDNIEPLFQYYNREAANWNQVAQPPVENFVFQPLHYLQVPAVMSLGPPDVQNRRVDIEFLNPDESHSAPEAGSVMRRIDHEEVVIQSSSSDDEDEAESPRSLRRSRHLAVLNRHISQEMARAAHVPHHGRRFVIEAVDPEIEVAPEVLDESHESSAEDEDNIMFTIVRSVCRRCMMVKNDKKQRGPSKLNPNAPDDLNSLNSLINHLPLPKPLKIYLKYKRNIIES